MMMIRLWQWHNDEVNEYGNNNNKNSNDKDDKDDDDDDDDDDDGIELPYFRAADISFSRVTEWLSLDWYSDSMDLRSLR